MITTLAWLSPINCSHRNYRPAQLELRAGRSLTEDPIGATHPQVRRGTVRHEVREGRGAQVVNDVDEIEIHANAALTRELSMKGPGARWW